LDRISTDPEFYKGLKRSEEEEAEEQDVNDSGSDNGEVSYDDIDSSVTIEAAIADIIACTPADSLADIYADKDDGLLSESDAEDGGTGTNLDMYTGDDSSMYDATGGWMEWNGK
jgi:hypothetical protein